MARKFENQDGPYEYERAIRSGSKFTSVAYGVAGFAVAAGLALGTAFAVNAQPHESSSSQTPVSVVTADDQGSVASSSTAANTISDPESSNPSNEVSPPVNVLKPSLSGAEGDSDLNDDSDHAFEDHDSGFESEDSEDD